MIRQIPPVDQFKQQLRIVGHSDISLLPHLNQLGGRSSDPGIKFDWGILENAGLGLQRMQGPIDFSTAYGGFFNAHLNGRIRAGAAGVTSAIITELKADLTRIGYSVSSDDKYDDSVRMAIMVFCEHFRALDSQESVDRTTAEIIKRIVGFLVGVKP
jgi:N-acetyl-anhydromuramyl-L-alanine amidase AmpD